jgi:protein transport protein SEC24
MGDVFAGADAVAIASLLSKKAIDRSLTTKFEDAREALTYKLADILATFKRNFSHQSTHPQQLVVCENLAMLPILILAILKSLALRASVNIPSDLRAFSMYYHYVACPEAGIINLHPRFWCLNDIIQNAEVSGLMLLTVRLGCQTCKGNWSSLTCSTCQARS